MDHKGDDTVQVPMSIRIKWEGRAWWAYFSGWPRSYFFSESLADMCNAIRITFPPGSMTTLPREFAARARSTGEAR